MGYGPLSACPGPSRTPDVHFFKKNIAAMTCAGIRKVTKLNLADTQINFQIYIPYIKKVLLTGTTKSTRYLTNLKRREYEQCQTLLSLQQNIFDEIETSTRFIPTKILNT